jgi:hypothetical protein
LVLNFTDFYTQLLNDGLQFLNGPGVEQLRSNVSAACHFRFSCLSIGNLFLLPKKPANNEYGSAKTNPV